jgi:hypothetical protein
MRFVTLVKKFVSEEESTHQKLNQDQTDSLEWDLQLWSKTLYQKRESTQKKLNKDQSLNESLMHS